MNVVFGRDNFRLNMKVIFLKDNFKIRLQMIFNWIYEKRCKIKNDFKSAKF